MSTLEDKIAALEAEIEGYRVRLEAATTEERKDRLLEVITAARNNLTELLKAQAASRAPASTAPLGKHPLSSV